MWGGEQDDFLESMAAASQAVHEYMHGQILYINVMNNLSVDCDCDGHPAKPEMGDVGILILERAAEIGLGSREYKLVSLDK